MNFLHILLVGLSFNFLQDVPFKPSAEFQAAVDLQFKSKPGDGNNSFDGNGNKVKQQTGLLPFLSVKISALVPSNGEIRLRAVDALHAVLLSKKISPNTSYRLDMGFIQDLKNESATSTIVIYFLNEKKVEVSKIVLNVTKEGDFLVNGEKRGQF
jgi:hypothetical protein